MEMKERAIEAAQLFDRLMIDLIIGTRSLEIFEAFNRNKQLLAVTYHGMRRMAYSHIILSLNKYLELYQAYHDVIPASCRKECKRLMKIIESKPIEEFRHKYVGHLLDKKTKRPLSVTELENIIPRIYGEDETIFLHWVNKRGRKYPETVVSILQKTRDEIMQDNAISKEEFDQWKDLGHSDA